MSTTLFIYWAWAYLIVNVILVFKLYFYFFLFTGLTMVRQYKKTLGTRPYANFSSEVLEEALTKIAENRLSIREASRQYNISFGTLYNRFHGKHVKHVKCHGTFMSRRKNNNRSCGKMRRLGVSFEYTRR